jgi:hypothetical protein
MTDRFGWMPVTPKVDAFERKVGRDDSFVIRWHTQNSAIVTDAGDDAATLFDLAADMSD